MTEDFLFLKPRTRYVNQAGEKTINAKILTSSGEPHHPYILFLVDMPQDNLIEDQFAPIAAIALEQQAAYAKTDS